MCCRHVRRARERGARAHTSSTTASRSCTLILLYSLATRAPCARMRVRTCTLHRLLTAYTNTRQNRPAVSAGQSSAPRRQVVEQGPASRAATSTLCNTRPHTTDVVCVYYVRLPRYCPTVSDSVRCKYTPLRTPVSAWTDKVLVPTRYYYTRHRTTTTLFNTRPPIPPTSCACTGRCT